MNSLNPSQQQAVDHPSAHVLIVAGPGTGKTHTLTHRIAKTAPSLGPGERILAITFTNKAAKELRKRLDKLLPKHADFLKIGTFHQFCFFFLRKYHAEAGLSHDFRVASQEDIELLGAQVWPDLNLRQRKIRLEEISLWKASEFDEEIPEEVAALNRDLRKNNALDFDDLILETIHLLRAQESVLKKVRATYRHIFVDEYQDVNPAQYALLKILIGDENSLTAIGDPNQAIYGFRRASVKFFLRFQQDFPDAAVLSLSENYRCATNLLAASGQVMAKHSKMPVTELTARIFEPGRLTMAETPTDKAEAEFVVHEIEKMVGGTSMFSRDSGRVDTQDPGRHSFGDIAVLYRLHSQCRLLREAFDRSGIPYKIFGNKAAEKSQDFLDHFYFPQNEDESEQGEKVALLTLHAAKGLEFPAVFIMGCEENLLPLGLEGMSADPEEERRLFYVGMTRAKERLVLLRARRRMLYGKTYQNLPSPFLADIAESLKEYERTRPMKPREPERQMKLF